MRNKSQKFSADNYCLGAVVRLTIYEYLEPSDKVNCSMVCKIWNEDFEGDNIWKDFCHEIGISTKIFDGMVWKDIYFFSIYHGFNTLKLIYNDEVSEVERRNTKPICSLLKNISFKPKEKYTGVMLSLGSDGKTTIFCNWLHLYSSIIPSDGFTHVSIKRKNTVFSLLVGSSASYHRNRVSWFNTSTANPFINIMIWVVSSNYPAKSRYYFESHYWLNQVLLTLPERIPILIISTKNDLEESLPPYHLAKILGLLHLKRRWYIICANPSTGGGCEYIWRWIYENRYHPPKFE